MKSVSRKAFVSWTAALGLCLMLGGCARYVLNQPASAYDPAAGYRFPEAKAASESAVSNSDALFVCLAFSGGGTRAAAFAYGVLEKLKATPIVWEGKSATLLDEVDCISGISGGAFTAAYYGLFGNQIFKDFRSRFLERDVQGELLSRALNPLNWPRLASAKFNRIDLATELYDETIFAGKTYDDLVKQGRRPFIILNATNLASGDRFEFTQNEFDFLGSDLGPFPVARAVAASSAFPFLLSPVTLQNYPSPPGYAPPADVARGLADFDANRRRWHWAARHNDYLDKKTYPYVHLMDGGLSDNIGLRAIENAYRRSSGFIRTLINNGRIEKLVVIVVNARTQDQSEISKASVPPELGDVGYKTATISLDNYSFETIETMKDLTKSRRQTQKTVAICNERLAQCRSPVQFPTLSGDVEPMVIDLDFEAIPDPKFRDELLGLPTSFDLPEHAVKQLIRAAGELLDGSREFQELLRELNPGDKHTAADGPL